MTDLKSPALLWLKAVLFFFIGLAGSALILIEVPTLKSALLLALIIWAFCRACYFAFYVLEHYVDSNFRYSGLISLLRYALKRKR